MPACRAQMQSRPFSFRFWLVAKLASTHYEWTPDPQSTNLDSQDVSRLIPLQTYRPRLLMIKP
jgi:hypothetical protein